MSDGITFPFLRQVGSLWTPEEDLVLLRHVAVHGTKYWGFLQTSGTLPHRDQKACCNRFILLKKRHFLERGKNVARGLHQHPRDDLAAASSMISSSAVLSHGSSSSLANDPSQSTRQSLPSHTATTAPAPTGSALASATAGTAAATATAAGAATGGVATPLRPCRTDSAAQSSQRLMTWAATAGRKLQGELKRCREESAAEAAAVAEIAMSGGCRNSYSVSSVAEELGRLERGAPSHRRGDDGVTAAAAAAEAPFEVPSDAGNGGGHSGDYQWARSVKPRLNSPVFSVTAPTTFIAASPFTLPNAAATAAATSAATAAASGNRASLNLDARLLSSLRAFAGRASALLPDSHEACEARVPSPSHLVPSSRLLPNAAAATAPSFSSLEPVSPALYPWTQQAQHIPPTLGPAPSSFARQFPLSPARSSLAPSSAAAATAATASAAPTTTSTLGGGQPAAVASAAPSSVAAVPSPSASSLSFAASGFSLSYTFPDAGWASGHVGVAQAKKWGYLGSGEVDREEVCMVQCVPGERRAGWNMHEQVVPRSLSRTRQSHLLLDPPAPSAAAAAASAAAAADVRAGAAAATSAAAAGAAVLPAARLRLPSPLPSVPTFSATRAFHAASPAGVPASSATAKPVPVRGSLTSAQQALQEEQEQLERTFPGAAAFIPPPANTRKMPADGAGPGGGVNGAVAAARSKDDGVFGWMHGGGANPEHLQALLGEMTRQAGGGGVVKGQGLEINDESLAELLAADAAAGGAAGPVGASMGGFGGPDEGGKGVGIGEGTGPALGGEAPSSGSLLDVMLDGLCDLLVPDWDPSSAAADALPSAAAAGVGSDAAAAAATAAPGVQQRHEQQQQQQQQEHDLEQLQFVAALFEEHQQGQQQELHEAWGQREYKNQHWVPVHQHHSSNPNNTQSLQSLPQSISSLFAVPEAPNSVSRRAPRRVPAGSGAQSCVVPNSFSRSHQLPAPHEDATRGRNENLYGSGFSARPDLLLERMAASRSYHL